MASLRHLADLAHQNLSVWLLPTIGLLCLTAFALLALRVRRRHMKLTRTDSIANPMRAFICTRRPRSVNAKKTPRFVREIQEAHRHFHGSAGFLDGLLYGLVYYLHARPTQIDADNLSKPVWDALRGVAYVDDSVIRHRRAGVIDLRISAFHSFDLSRVPDAVAAELISAVGSQEHIIYVEYGTLRDEMFTFGLPRSDLK